MQHSKESDFELVRQFNAGSEAAFTAIVGRYQEKIYWHARRMTGNHLDADDVVQETLLTMYKKLRDFKFKSSLYTWIYTITNTRTLNLLKRKKLRQFFSIDDEEEPLQLPGGENVAVDFETRQKIEMLDAVLQTLPAKQREVFLFRNYEQLSYEEISAITGKSAGALKANYFHALEKIKSLMKETD